MTTWQYDYVADRISTHADPSVSFDLEVKEYIGNRYVVLSVDQFVDIPVLCKRDYPGVLRNGACYVRTRRKQETSEIPTQVDMGVTSYLDRARRLGLIVFPAVTPAPTDQELFDQQLGDLR